MLGFSEGEGGTTYVRLWGAGGLGLAVAVVGVGCWTATRGWAAGGWWRGGGNVLEPGLDYAYTIVCQPRE